MKRSESDIRGPWWHVAQGLAAPANAALVGACHSQLLFPGCLVKALSSWFFSWFLEGSGSDFGGPGKSKTIKQYTASCRMSLQKLLIET